MKNLKSPPPQKPIYQRINEINATKDAKAMENKRIYGLRKESDMKNKKLNP